MGLKWVSITRKWGSKRVNNTVTYYTWRFTKLGASIVFLGCCFITCRWGQIFILDSLAQYTPKDDREAQRYCMLYLIRKHSVRVYLLKAVLL